MGAQVTPRKIFRSVSLSESGVLTPSARSAAELLRKTVRVGSGPFWAPIGASLRRSRKGIVWNHLRILRRIFRDSPVPFPYWRLYRYILSVATRTPHDSIFPSTDFICSLGDSRIPELRGLISADELGYWSLDVETIAIIWTMLHREKPDVIVECGSGISTLVLASYAALAASRGERCCLISLEQDEESKNVIENRLARTGVGRFATILHVPSDDKAGYSSDIFSRLLTCVVDKPVDFVLIDGPSGLPGCRSQTLPMLLPYMRNGARLGYG